MKVSRQLSKLKYNAYKLKEGGQIPSSLFEAICRVDESYSVEEVKFLTDLCFISMRVKRFYNLFPEEALSVDKQLELFEKSRKDQNGDRITRLC